MRIGRLDIGKWYYPNPEDKKFIWFEYLEASCKCKILTVLDVCFTWFGKDCQCQACKKYVCECE